MNVKRILAPIMPKPGLTLRLLVVVWTVSNVWSSDWILVPLDLWFGAVLYFALQRAERFECKAVKALAALAMAESYIKASSSCSCE